MSNVKALVPVEQLDVAFYEDEILAVIVNVGGEPSFYVPLRPIVERFGLNWAGQQQRINRDPVLSDEARPCVVVTHTQGQPDQRRQMLCLPLEFLSGFLFGINANRVKDEVRDSLIMYQRECYKVLDEALQDRRLTADPSFSELLESDSPAAQAYKMAKAMMTLARNQLLLEGRVDSHGQLLEQHGQRLEELEATLGDPERHITPEQASQISQSVKAVAMQLSKQSGLNEYGGVYGELYRKFGITSYKLLPAKRFQEAMDFLSNWYGSLTGEEPF